MKMGCCFSCCTSDDDVGGSETGDDTRPLIDPVSNSTPVVIVPRSDSLTVTAITGQSTKGQEDELAKILQETASAMIDVSCSGSHSLDQREFQDRSRNYLHRIQALNPSLLLNPNPHQPDSTLATSSSAAAATMHSTSSNVNILVSTSAPVISSTSSPRNTSAGVQLSSSLSAITTTTSNMLMNPSLTTIVAPSNLLLVDVPNPEKHLGTELISEEDEELMSFAMDEIEKALYSIRVEYDDELVVPFGNEYSSQAASPSSDRMVMVSD